MVKKYWRPTPDYYDERRRQAITEIGARLPTLVENRDEEGYVQLLKKWFPEMTPEELLGRIRRFRDAVQEKHGDR
jgi:hypothetical protein